MLEFLNYQITWDNVTDRDKIPDSLLYELERIYSEIQNPKKSTVSKLQKLIKKYPENPQLKNYLTVVYKELGDYNKAMSYNDELLKQHPKYFFALVNKAYHYEFQKEYEKMKELLGTSFDLKKLYPEREVFHISEFMIMQMMAVSYYAGTGDMEQANLRLEFMKDVEKDSAFVQKAEEIMIAARRDDTLKRFTEEQKLKITPEHKFSPNLDLGAKSDFNYTETNKLYTIDFAEDLENIREYLSLDRDRLIEDLDMVLKYDYTEFMYRPEEDDTEAGFHAYNLLGELEAEEALPTVLEMMCMDDEYLDRTFGDYLTQDGWMSLIKMSKNRPGDLENYLKLPGGNTYFRSVAIDTLTQMFIHYPDKQNEVKNIYKRLLQFFIKSEIEDNVIDSVLNGFFISDLIDLRLKEFLPQIKELYDSKKVSRSICGDFKDAERDINNIQPYPYAKREIKSIYELYEFYYRPDDDDFTFDSSKTIESLNKLRHLTPRTTAKIGRNDPCPCGSGKKFKKCCLGKGIYD